VLLGHRVEHEISLTEDLVDLLDPEGLRSAFHRHASFDVARDGAVLVEVFHVSSPTSSMESTRKTSSFRAGPLLPSRSTEDQSTLLGLDICRVSPPWRFDHSFLPLHSGETIPHHSATKRSLADGSV